MIWHGISWAKLYVEDPNYFTRGATSACSSKSYKEKCVSSSSTQNKHYGPSPNVMTLVDLEDEMKEDLMANDLEWGCQWHWWWRWEWWSS